MYQTQFFNPYQYQVPNQYPIQPPYPQYQVPQAQAVPQVNAVKIDINNPQAYGSTNGATSAFGYPNNSMYNMPFVPTYNASQTLPQQNQQFPQIAPISYSPQILSPQQTAPVMPQPIIPQAIQQAAPVLPQQPIMPVIPSQNIAPAAVQQPAAPAVQPIPVPVPTPLPPVPAQIPVANIDKPAAAPVITPQQAIATVVQPQQPQQVTPVAPVAPVAPQAPAIANNIDVTGLINDLGSADVDKQTSAIQKIAEVAQADTNSAKVLLVEPVFNKLIGIINADTSKLQGPTGKNYDPKNLSPLEKAEINKQFAIYTLAILQKNFREEINKEMKKNNLPDVAINDLPYIKEVVNNLKDNPNPTIREACLSALNYVGKPEDKNVLKTLYDISAKHDASPSVKAAASNYLSKLK